MQAITDKFDLWKVQLRLDYFSAYLKAIENFLENEARELDNRFTTVVQELERDENFPWEHGTPDQLAAFFLEEDYERLKNKFPSLLRRSLFLTVYSVLEVGLNDCCYLLNLPGKSLKDIKGKGINRAYKYLIYAEVNFPLSSEWHEILNYQKLRNCIAHNGGRLRGCDHSEHLRNYISRRNSHLSITPYNDEVEFHKGFCEKVIQTVNSFLDQLSASLKGWERKEDF